jgi:hypothetical protein
MPRSRSNRLTNQARAPDAGMSEPLIGCEIHLPDRHPFQHAHPGAATPRRDHSGRPIAADWICTIHASRNHFPWHDVCVSSHSGNKPTIHPEVM